MTDQQLMQEIKTNWGVAIGAHCHSSSVPESFLAALIANESGGDQNAKRFEKGVLAFLWEVLLERKTNYGSIGRADLLAYIAQTPLVVTAGTSDMSPTFADAFARFDALATSWGLTQIMGYHILEGGVWTGADGLATPEVNLRTSIHMLTDFAHRFSLDLAADFGDLLHCWNAGSPTAPTFDPHYVSNALNRKAIYEALP